MTYKTLSIIALVAALALVGTQVPAAAQDAANVSPIKITYMKWIQNDIVRLVEEIKRAKDPWERRDLVEDIEWVIWERVEFPMSYQEVELTDTYDLSRVGVTSDAGSSLEANENTPEIAVCYALLGVAKGYEGFGAAATDYFAKATDLYRNVMSVPINLDHGRDNRPLAEWVSASRAYWGKSSTTRVTFYGKRVSQGVVDDLNNDQVEFLPENPRVSKYVLFAAKRDFTRGVKNYLMTDDSLRERRPNKFSIYLEPGQYRLKTGVTNTYNVGLTVSRNVNENAFIIETLQQGMALYAIPDVQIFEAEMKKALASADELREDEAAAEDLGLDTGSDLANEADSLDIDDLPLE